MEQPPFPFKNPVEGYLRLTADGVWLYKGEPITHPGLVHILESNYGHGPEGGFEVRLGFQRVTVEVEDTPYFIRALECNGDDCWIHVNDGTRQVLEPARVCIGAHDRTYVTLPSGDDARFLRKAELDLGAFLEEQDGRLGLRLGGRWTPLGSRDSGAALASRAGADESEKGAS